MKSIIDIKSSDLPSRSIKFINKNNNTVIIDIYSLLFKSRSELAKSITPLDVITAFFDPKHGTVKHKLDHQVEVYLFRNPNTREMNIAHDRISIMSSSAGFAHSHTGSVGPGGYVIPAATSFESPESARTHLRGLLETKRIELNSINAFLDRKSTLEHFYTLHPDRLFSFPVRITADNLEELPVIRFLVGLSNLYQIQAERAIDEYFSRNDQTFDTMDHVNAIYRNCTSTSLPPPMTDHSIDMLKNYVNIQLFLLDLLNLYFARIPPQLVRGYVPSLNLPDSQQPNQGESGWVKTAMSLLAIIGLAASSSPIVGRL